MFSSGRRLLAMAVMVAGIAIGVVTTGAQAAFPEKGKAIRLIVPYAAGGATDAAARLLAAELEKTMGTIVRVENMPGAASQVAMSYLVASAPDGYTLSYAVIPTILSHYLDKARGANYNRSNFQPIAMHHFIPAMIAVPVSSPYKTLADMVAAAKAAPQQVSVSDSGTLGNPHLATLMLQHAAGVQFGSVHFDGGAPSITAMLGGHVNALAGGLPDGAPHLKSGAARILGVASTERSPFLPDTPTMKEQGYDVVSISATGILAPAGTPTEVVDTLTKAIEKVINSEKHKQDLMNLSAQPAYMNPKDYEAFWIDAEKRVSEVLATFDGK